MATSFDPLPRCFDTDQFNILITNEGCESANSV
jgi:hypothetical protein